MYFTNLVFKYMWKLLLCMELSKLIFFHMEASGPKTIFEYFLPLPLICNATSVSTKFPCIFESTSSQYSVPSIYLPISKRTPYGFINLYSSRYSVWHTHIVLLKQKRFG